MSGQMVQVSTIRELGEYLARYAESIRSTLPQTTRQSAERFIRLTANAARTTPKILQCHPGTVVNALLFFAQLDLEPASALGHGWLVPYGKVCQPIVGYRGFIELALRVPMYVGVEAHVVREGDAFDWQQGTEPRIVHRPNFGGRGEVCGAYAIVTRADGGKQSDVVDREEIDAVRARSKASDDGPWKTDFAEMAKKTAVRRLAKYLRLSPQLAQAIEVENRAEAGMSPLDDGAIDVEMTPAPDETLKEQIQQKAREARGEK
jgi:recombination protein RecT